MRLVLKFGGTSVADIGRMRHVATIVAREIQAGHEVAVVVSAMAGTTNQLVRWVEEASPIHDDPREYDAVVSTGEQVTAGLMALLLQDHGLTARSWLGWQIPIRTSALHAKARILGIEGKDLVASMARGEVPVVAGFQGVAPDGRITTVGRGGSDTAAVALAAALKADRCDIYTDVDGVYTCDPRIVPAARKLHTISYEEMLEMASLGAKVLQTRSVELAMKEGVAVQVRSSFTESEGTMVVDESRVLESEVIRGVTYTRDEAKVSLFKVVDQPGISASLFGRLADAGINVDMIVQTNAGGDGRTDMTFTVTRSDAARTKVILGELKETLGYDALDIRQDVAKISVVGLGMRSHVGVAKKMFETLADKKINIQVISTSEIKISVLIDDAYTELAVRSLHTAYGLDHGTPVL
jgi:aspartate kinase